MGRFDRKYSDEQRQAIIDAQLEDGLSARKAVELAETGHLGLPAFYMPPSTASGLAVRARRRHARTAITEDHDLADRVDQACARLIEVGLRIAKAEIDLLQEQASGDEALPTQSLSRIQKLGSLLREMRKLAMEPAAQPRHQWEEEGSDEHEPLIEQMMADYEALVSEEGSTGDG